MITASGGLLRFAPAALFVLIGLPVTAGLIGTILPALTEPAGAAFARLLAWPGLAASARLSVWVGLAATALSLGLTLMILGALQGTAVLRLILRVLSPLLSVPHAAAAFGLAFLISPSGLISRAFSPWATGWQTPPDLLILNDPNGLSLILGLVSKELPFLLLMALAALPQTDAPRLMALAETLGRGKVAAFLSTVLPRLYPQLRLPTYAVLAYSMTSADMAVILGPSLPPSLTVQIAQWSMDPDLAHRGVAAAGALLQLGLVAATLVLWLGLERGARWGLVAASLAGWRGARLDAGARVLATVLAGAVILALILGLAGLSLWSVAGLWTFPGALPESLTLKTWVRAAPDLAAHGATTIHLALAATMLALILVLGLLQSAAITQRTPGNALLFIIYLPLLLPQIAFLPGLFHLSALTGSPGGFWAVAMVHVLFVLPYVYLSLSPAWAAWDARIATIAATLGASEARIFWRLRLPMLIRAVLTAAAVGVAVSVGQYLPSLLMGGGRIETLTTEAVALSSGGNRRIIGAYGLLQMLIPAFCFALALILPNLLARNRRGLAVMP